MTISRAIILSFLIHGAAAGVLVYRQSVAAGLDVKQGSVPVSAEQRMARSGEFTVTVSAEPHDPMSRYNHTDEKNDPGAKVSVLGVLSRQAREHAANRGPEYPRLAIEREYQGEVVLDIRIDGTGSVESVAVVRSSGYDLLDRAAIIAARAWKFSLPGGVNFSGPVAIQQRIAFRLR